MYMKPYTGFCHEQITLEHIENNNDLEQEYCNICKRIKVDACNYYENEILVCEIIILYIQIYKKKFR